MRPHLGFLDTSYWLIAKPCYIGSLVVRLRDRLQQVERHELSQEQELDRVKGELLLVKDINSSQDQTILSLNQEIAHLNSSEARTKANDKVDNLLEPKLSPKRIWCFQFQNV